MDLNNLLQQAQALKTQFEEKKQKFEQEIFIGKAGGGLVTIELKGNYKISKLNIDKQIFTQDAKITTDLIIAAFNNAIEQIDDAKSELTPSQISDMGDFSKFF